MLKVREGLDIHYSGLRSVRFWERIGALKDDSKMYNLGVMLQNLEEHVIDELLKAERDD